MAKIKDIPQVDRPREKFLKKGPEALSKSELLAILLGSGIKGKNVRQLSQQIIKKFGKNFLSITVDDLKGVAGIGEAKALQIASAISLVKRFYAEDRTNKTIVRNSQDVASLAYDLRSKKKEHLVCLYLNARKEIVSVGLADKTLVHPREVFYSATELKDQSRDFDYVAEGIQEALFDLLEIEKPAYEFNIQKIDKHYVQPQESKSGYFHLQNRRYLGNKYKLLGFIEDIISEKCGAINSLCDIFAGTGVVGERFNTPDIKIISNDFLFANYVCLQAFLGVNKSLQESVPEKVEYLNRLPSGQENYFSKHFGGAYFTDENARKIGAIREEIERIAEHDDEKNILICSLIYAVDKVANTVGHYDAFRKKLDMLQPIKLLVPDIDYSHNANNGIYKEDANALIRKITCDVLYIDPPYNSRQYSDAYHLLENLAEWKKPEVAGVGKKMDRSHIKSDYCLKSATSAFADLIRNANCKHILLSYNNTGDSKDGRSNARMRDAEILQVLNDKGSVEIFEKNYKAFTTGKSDGENNAERIFYCRVTK